MSADRSNCAAYLDDDWVLAELQSNDEARNNKALQCLFTLHANFCIRLMIDNAGGYLTGEEAQHNATSAFNEALLVVRDNAKNGSFVPDGKPDAVRRYLYTIGLRQYRKERVKQDKKQVKSLPETYEVPERSDLKNKIEMHDLFARTMQAIKNIGEKCQQVLWMRFINSYSIEEIAAEMKLENQQVRRRLRSE